MAGGDFALIKSVEGFEDFTAFGKKQINDLGVSPLGRCLHWRKAAKLVPLSSSLPGRLWMPALKVYFRL